LTGIRKKKKKKRRRRRERRRRRRRRRREGGKVSQVMLAKVGSHEKGGRKEGSANVPHKYHADDTEAPHQQATK